MQSFSDAFMEACDGSPSHHLKDISSELLFKLYDESFILELYGLAQNNDPVLIYGESGTGQSLIAKTIHLLSPRRDKPFEKCDCLLLDDAVFYHESKQLARKVAGGTLFIDKVAEASPTKQAQLHFVLERQRDMKIISTTDADLRKAALSGTFHDGLFFQLSTFSVNLPTLKERIIVSPDIINLYFNQLYFKSGNIKIDGSALSKLLAYPYRGNYIELDNICRYIEVNDHDGIVTVDDLPEPLRDYMPA
jgi:Nif-specific regulatory protein